MKYSSHSHLPLKIVSLFTAVLACHLFYQAAAFSGPILFHDQWDLYTPMFNQDGPVNAFMYQHGPHRQGLGGIITYFTANATGFSHRIESIMIAVFLVGASILAVALKKRLTSEITVWDTAIPLIVLNPVQIETITVTPNLSHSILPLFLLLCFAHCYISQHPMVRYAAAPALATIALFTGFGFFVFTGALFIYVYDWIFSIWKRNHQDTCWRTFGLAFFCFGSVIFSIEYQWDPANPDVRFPHLPIHDYVVFIHYLFGRLFYLPSPIRPYIGFTILLCLLAVLLRTAIHATKDLNAIDSIILLFLATSFGFIIANSFGRVSLGVNTGGSSRYLSLALPAILTLHLILSQSRSCRWKTPRLAIFLILAALSYASNVFYASDLALSRKAAKESWLEAYRSTENVVQATRDSGYEIYPKPEAIISRLDHLKSHGLSAFREEDSAPVPNQFQPRD